ncbi:TonB-dependent receptor [Cupriavidus necator]|uniref:TonB-dependent receptor n=1 Tax=Cupriavidus necator TaxID=106590 RepID=A0A367PJP8_CUPNE|nr:TonB-dependent receptor [Cupriavidus necator]QQX86666.1 TonB-dependent receptor [Cupriavidus necator]RCJ07256.1 TonB-dependent receptor [Cupriavidus necator]
MELPAIRRYHIVAPLAASLWQAGVSGAEAQTAGPAHDLHPVLVVGDAYALPSAQEIRHENVTIVDAVVADEIGKLPDFSVGEALQRIPGVQSRRDRGETGGVSVRGLGQVETTLNGREVFTASAGRSLDASDIPSELLNSVSVYKTAPASMIEGGIGGTIDLRTYRPFDFQSGVVAASARVTYGDLVRQGEPQFSLLLSDRGKLAGEDGDHGEIGVLLNVSRQRRGWREDQQGTGAPVARTDLVPGQTVYAPNGSTNTISSGQRERTAGNLALQWRSAPSLELYAEGSYAELRTAQDSHQINVFAAPTFAAGSPTVFSGSGNLSRITWTNAPVSILSFARDTTDRDGQAAIGGSWTGRALTLSADASYTRSSNQLMFSGLGLGGTASAFTHDLSSTLPGTAVTGTDLGSPSSLRYTDVLYRSQRFDGHLGALRIDGEYQFVSSPLNALAAGVRFADRSATNAPGLVVADAPVGGIPVASMPGFVMRAPYSDYFAGRGSSIDGFLVGSLALARDPAALRKAFGITSQIPAAASPLSDWNIRERTQTAYVMASIRGRGAPFDGNIGLRAIHTDEAVSGAQSVPGSTDLASVRRKEGYVDWLPSANIRYALVDGLLLRAGASRTMARPDFDQLSPSLTLLRNSIDPSQNRGTAGNPELEPVRANNLDIAIERYFGAASSLSLTGFQKWIDGFVATVSAPETYDGETYQVSRPRNTGAGRIRGLEVAYRQFLDFLPGPLAGIGIQANYTYIGGSTEIPNTGTLVPLQNVSPHSVNLIGMYEYARISARLAYSWRDRSLSGMASIAGIGLVPVYTAPCSWLDASLRYRVDRHLTIGVEGKNLLQTMRRSYYGTPDRPQNNWMNDIQVSLVADIRF